MCSSNTYCCRKPGDMTTNCCNNTALLSSTSSAMGMPTRNAAMTETIAPSNTTCALATEANFCQGSSKTVAIGAGIGVSLGTLLIASLVALVTLTKQLRKVKSRLAKTDKSMEDKDQISMPISQHEGLPADSIGDRSYELYSVSR